MKGAQKNSTVMSRPNAEKIEQIVKSVFTPHLIGRIKSNKVRDNLSFRWQKTFKRLLPLGGASVGNKLTLYTDGNEAFQNMWASIDKAQRKVYIETYILEPDHIGKKTLSKLADAASRGCDVRLIYDYVGSRKIGNSHLQQLRDNGGAATAFNPIFDWPWKWRAFGFFRNHRKILVVDDFVGYCGGMNIGDEYAGPEIGGNGYFRDTHVKVEGPAVDHLVKVFLSSEREALRPHGEDTEEIADITPLTKKDPSDKQSSGVFIQILQSNVARNKRHIQKAMRLTLKESSEHCYMTTPYFLPPYKLKQSILRAASRGIDVKILTAGISDAPLVRMASQHVYHQFLANGVKIYEMTHIALHAKTVTIDGIYSSIGSFNLDPWSHFHNLELNLTTVDPDIANKLEEQFLSDLKNCQEYLDSIRTVGDVSLTSDFSFLNVLNYLGCISKQAGSSK